MTATREQPNGSIQRLVDTLTTAGVRFAYFSPCTYRLTKPLANSMGLETGWNCAISLREWEDEIAKMLEGCGDAAQRLGPQRAPHPPLELHPLLHRRGAAGT